MAITASDVKNLREATGAGMMDCKKALNETDGDYEKAVAWLREKGITKAAKRAGRVAAEGAVASYIHFNGKVGVMVEINCETDFVARGDDFQNFVKDVCQHISFSAPRYISSEEIPEADMMAEKTIFMAQAKESGKPENIQEKMADGMLKKWYKEVCLLEQESQNPKHEGKSINQLLLDLGGRVGEKITIRRFVRYALGEGIEKVESNLAEDVAAELAKHGGQE